MARIIIKQDNLDTEVPDGKDLREFCQENNSSICFGCEVGVCATCLIEVKEGMENLSEPDEIEKNTLERIGSKAFNRLACQCKIKKGKTVID